MMEGKYPLSFKKGYFIMCFFVSVIRCQDIANLTLTKNSGCEEGLIDQVDSFIVTGIVDSTGVPSGWQYFVEFQRQGKTDSDFSTICGIFINSCGTTANKDCDCIKNGNIHSVFLNRPAGDLYDSAEIKLLLTNRNDSVREQSKVIVVDKVYETGSEIVSVHPPITSNSTTNCTFQVPQGTSVTYCCIEAPSPCVASVTFKGQRYTNEQNDNGCAEVASSVVEEGEYTFSYTICGGSSDSFSCIASIVNSGTTETSNATASLNATVSSTTESSKEPACDTGCIVGSTIGGVAGVSIIAGIGYAIYRHAGQSGGS